MAYLAEGIGSGFSTYFQHDMPQKGLATSWASPLPCATVLDLVFVLTFGSLSLNSVALLPWWMIDGGPEVHITVMKSEKGLNSATCAYMLSWSPTFEVSEHKSRTMSSVFDCRHLRSGSTEELTQVLTILRDALRPIEQQ